MKSQNGKRWHIYSLKNISWWLILEWKVCCVAHSSCYVSSNDWSRVNMNHLLLWYDWFTFSKTVLTFPSRTHWKTFIFPRKIYISHLQLKIKQPCQHACVQIYAAAASWRRSNYTAHLKCDGSWEELLTSEPGCLDSYRTTKRLQERKRQDKRKTSEKGRKEYLSPLFFSNQVHGSAKFSTRSAIVFLSLNIFENRV